MESVPVIVMTGHGLDSHELVVRVWNAGAVNFVGKPVTAAKLSKVINDALDHCASADSAAPDQKPLQPFHDPQENTRRKMVIYPDRVTLCGAIVWQDKLQPDMRTILLKLSEKTKDGYKRITGPNLINRYGFSLRGADGENRVEQSAVRVWGDTMVLTVLAPWLTT